MYNYFENASGPGFAAGVSTKNLDKILTNNSIRAKEVRVISETGEQLGVMSALAAVELAKSRGLDLIQVTEKVEPPVCRIGNYGKYLYSQQKKERKIRAHTKESKLKEIQIGFNTSPHDIAVRAGQAEKFLKNGDKVKVNMVLRGREKAMGDIAKKKVELFVSEVNNLLPVKLERELKREVKGFTLIISKK